MSTTAGDRYARQAILDVIGQEGQRRLSQSTVVIVGCGALGSAQAELLARAGVGRLVVVDRDILELHNLQRQTLFDEQDVRERLPKAIAAERRLRAINSTIQIDACPADVTATNVEELTAPADLVLDGTDNFETRYLLNDAMVKAGKPWVYGGVLGTEGTIMAIRPGQGPCLRCVFPEPPDGRALPTCETQGVLNTAVAWVAAQQVTLALKILVGRPLEVARLHAIDVWQCSVTSVTATTAPDCVCCGQRRFEFLDAERGATSTILCGRNSVQVTPERPSPVDLESLRRRLEGHGEVSVNGLLLELAMGERRLVMFPDGRVLVMGTTDASEARSLVARYLGA